jgi:membrane-associated phospholipid phosphatase
VGLLDVRSSEWVSLVYFGVLTALAWLRPLPAARRIQITAMGLPMCAAILLAAHHGGSVVRDWAPGVSIVVGYYQSGRFFVTPSERFEAWLMAWDRRLLGDPTTRFARWPAALLAYLEIVYVTCFLLIPAGFAALALSGRSALADRYWTMVVAAELGSFGSLSVIPSRPPWLVERKAALPDRAVHRFASRMIERFTIRVNTFPSGHVAGSLAVAFALIGTLPWTGAAFLFLALSISVACVVGRYHYVIDGVAGAALAVAVWAAVQVAGR